MYVHGSQGLRECTRNMDTNLLSETVFSLTLHNKNFSFMI